MNEVSTFSYIVCYSSKFKPINHSQPLTMSEIKVLSVNPGATERIPTYNGSHLTRRESIVPWSDKLTLVFGGTTPLYLKGSASRLLLRVVAALAFGGSAWLQLHGYMNVFGMEEYSYGCAIAAMVLASLMILGVGGRLSALGIAALSVAALISYAYNNGGVADFSPVNQLTLIYGALAATVAVLGMGHLTLPCWILGKIRRHR